MSLIANRTVMVGALAALTLGSSAPGPVPPQTEPPEEIMWRKLDLSHNVLDALAVEDFEALDAYGEDLVALSQAAELVIDDTQAYRSRSRVFTEAAEWLAKAARDKSVEGAALAYIDLSLSCLSCHQALGAELRSGPVESRIDARRSLDNPKAIMQAKLSEAHSILEAMVFEDYALLETSAKALTAMDQQAEWTAEPSATYQERSTAFRRAVEQIERATQKREIEAVALGYVEMTLKCVQCHRTLR